MFKSLLLAIDIASSLVLGQGWVPYPEYSDRQGWDDFFGEYRTILIDRGEQALVYRWQELSDDDYLAYERAGDRAVMEDKLLDNAEALGQLLVSELAEGEGRFLEGIAAGVEWFCRQPSWEVSAHLAKYQQSKSPVPDPDDQIFGLYQGNMSQMLSWAYYYFRDKMDPALAARLRGELQKKALDPYLQRDDFWWWGFDTSLGKKLNNWNPWCNQNALLCFMLLEDDPETLAKAVDKSIRSVQLWLDSLPKDGACDEGTTYWYKSVGHLLDYLENLERITGGIVSLWNDPLVRRLGEYIVNADIGDCWQVNFADGKPSRRPISYWIYRYGRATGNKLMMDFAVNACHRYGANPEDVSWYLFYQGLEAIRATREMKAQPSPRVSPHPFVDYPDAQVCFLRRGEAFLAAKGGNNYERHNHNDVGSCIYFYDYKPVLVDAGVGTYTRDTFGAGRFANWFVQSGWHNVPVINGFEQAFGAEFKASGSRARKALRRFSVDIAGAYPDSAAIGKWCVNYRLRRNGALRITHRFSLREAREPNELHLLVSDEPQLCEGGKIRLAGGVLLCYDPAQFTASVETKSLLGLGFSDRWGDALYRISLKAKRLQQKGKYVLKLQPSAEEPIPALTSRVEERAKAQFTLLAERLASDATPRTIYPDGCMKDVSIGSWTSGFFAGSLWQLYRLTQDCQVLLMARAETEKLASILDFPLSHDIGFQVNCSYGNAYRVTGEVCYLPMIEAAAAALADRFNPQVGATLSWAPGEKGAYPVIIDNMMNLELLEYASGLFACDSLKEIAITHARTTLRNHFRPDASCWHMLDYDPATGEVLRRVTVQGYSDDSIWSRGQAWALYGYVMMYRESGCPEFLAQAEKVARMLMEHLPADGIPYWDFSDPDIPTTYRDASAAAVICSALLELRTLTSDKALAATCLQIAEKQIRTLASPQYLAQAGTNGGFLLKHSVGNLPGGSEVDVPLPYADYYYLEALNRLKSIK